MTDPTPPQENLQVSFIEHHRPALEVGEYRVSVTQTLASAQLPATETYESATTFAVAGPRFALEPSLVDSVFPPANAQGAFHATLPHIVLTRRTLPWERVATTAPPKEGEVPRSWLALLLFDEKDPPPRPFTQSLEDLFAKNDPVLCYPSLTDREVGEMPTDRCTLIDVQTALFEEIAPSLDDLAWLAHARRVSTERKVDDASANDAVDNDYAVVIGNRLPTPGHKSTVHLVSLEGLAPYLPESSERPTEGSVRLVSLFSWSFDCTKQLETFGHILGKLCLEPSSLVLPLDPPKADAPDSTAMAQIRDALARGYMPLDHFFREGGVATSWYRGPLAPQSTSAKLETPIASADAALRYDPSTGMFDASYAAAWQLGRMLALETRDVATALHRWKARVRGETHTLLQRRMVADNLKGLGAPSAATALSTLSTAAVAALKLALGHSHSGDSDDGGDR